MIDVQPAADLQPCTWYRAGVTASLLDGEGDGVSPMTWDFRTGTTGKYKTVKEEMTYYLKELKADALFTDNADQFPRE